MQGYSQVLEEQIQNKNMPNVSPSPAEANILYILTQAKWLKYADCQQLEI